MRRIIFAVAILMALFSYPWSSEAFTGSGTASWAPPSTFSDGSALTPATDLSGYEIGCGPTAGSRVNITIVSGGTTTQITIPFPMGTTYCAVRTKTTAANGSTMSDWSAEVSKTVTAPPPSGCTGFTIK